MGLWGHQMPLLHLQPFNKAQEVMRGGGGDVAGARMNFVWGRAWEEPLVKGVGGSPGQAPLLLSPGPVIGGHHSPSLHSRR